MTASANHFGDVHPQSFDIFASFTLGAERLWGFVPVASAGEFVHVRVGAVLTMDFKARRIQTMSIPRFFRVVVLLPLRL